MTMAQSKIKQLARLAGLLEWPELRTHRHREITWYVSGQCEGGRNDLFLQFNHTPKGHDSYVGAVYAIRFRICTGWHPFTLKANEQPIEQVANQLEGWLRRRWFSAQPLRRTYRRMHPECAGYSWRRIRAEGLPYE